jgi:hypothetical protein
VLRRPRRAAVLALLAALAPLACGGGRRGPPPERFVPAGARAVLIVPDTGRAATALAALHATVSGFPGAGDLAGIRGALAAQLGFDPLDPDALSDAGVDPRRGAAVALLDAPGAQPGEAPATLVVLPAGDGPKLERLLARLAKDRLGATERASEPRGAVSVVVFRRPGGGGPPALSYVLVQKTALLTTHPSGPDLVAAAATLAPPASLDEHAGWKLARAALGEPVAAVAFAPAGSRLLDGLWAFKDGVALGVAATTGRLTARLAMLLGAREPSFRALAADGRGAALVSRLDPSAPLAARWDGDFAALGKKLVPMLSARDRAVFERRGRGHQRDLFSILAPGGAVALSLPAHLSLGELTAEATRRDPLRALEFEAAFPLQAGADAAAAAERITRAVGPPKAHGRGRAHAPDDGIVRVRTPSGEIAWKLDAAAGRLVAAGGRPGRIDALLARLAGSEPGWKARTPAAEAALSGGLGGVALDAPRLVAAVRALPDEAFGGGPSGFVMRSIVERAVDPAARLAAISLRAELAPGALRVDVEVEALGDAP